MNKLVSYALLLIALGLLGLNLYSIDYDNIWANDSRTAIYGVIVSLCVVMIVLINLRSLQIKEKLEGRN